MILDTTIKIFNLKPNYALIGILFLVLLFCQCKKQEEPKPDDEDTTQIGEIFVLKINVGSFYPILEDSALFILTDLQNNILDKRMLAQGNESEVFHPDTLNANQVNVHILHRYALGCYLTTFHQVNIGQQLRYQHDAKFDVNRRRRVDSELINLDEKTVKYQLINVPENDFISFAKHRDDRGFKVEEVEEGQRVKIFDRFDNSPVGITLRRANSSDSIFYKASSTMGDVYATVDLSQGIPYKRAHVENMPGEAIVRLYINDGINLFPIFKRTGALNYPSSTQFSYVTVLNHQLNTTGINGVEYAHQTQLYNGIPTSFDPLDMQLGNYSKDATAFTLTANGTGRTVDYQFWERSYVVNNQHKTIDWDVYNPSGDQTSYSLPFIEELAEVDSLFALSKLKLSTIVFENKSNLDYHQMLTMPNSGHNIDRVEYKILD